jgi:hypothetical protein
MQVPLKRTPGTSVVALEQPYARAAQPLDFSPITRQLEGFAKALTAKKDDLEEFDLKSRLIQETNELQSDFEQRKEAASLGDQNFTHQTLQDYEERHNKLVAEYRGQGYSEKALNDFSLRLGTLREHFGEQALAYQVHSTAVASDTKVDELTTRASQYAANNPVTGYTSTINEVNHSIDLLPGDATYKEERKQHARAIIRQGGLAAMARMHPEQVITALDPNGLTAPPAEPVGGAYDVVQSAISPSGNVTPKMAAVANTLSGELPAPVVAGFMGNFHIEGGYDGAQGDGGSASGIAQLRGERRQNFIKMFGVDPSQAKPEDQAKFILWEMKNPRAAGMTEAKRDAILAARTPAEAAALIDQHFERSKGTARQARMDAAEAFARDTAASPVRAATPTASAADQEIVVTGQRPPDLESVRTGIAILDDSTGAERLQALLQAREETNRKSTALKSSLDIVVANADAAIGLQGGYHGPVPPKETFIQAYGPIEGEQKYAAFASSLHTNQVVQTMQTLNPTAVQAQVESLRPNPNSPTLASDMQRYEAAQRAQAHVMQLRKDDPAAYVLQAYPDIANQMQQATTSEGRRRAYSAMERAFDQLQIPENERTYLTDDARAQMVQEYKVASPQQKLGLIETWMNEMGGRPGRLLHGEVDTNQDVAMYRTLSARGGDFRRTFLQVLEGQDIIAKDPARKPSPEAMISAFTSLPGRIAAINNLNPDVSRMYNEAAAALYVYRGGRVLPNSQGQLSDRNLYDQAIREVMGGTDPKGGFANFGHGKAPDHTILPPGVSSTEFENWRDGLVGSQPGRVGDLTRLSVRGLPPTDNRGHLITLHDIQDQGVFVMVAPGTYGIKLSSDGQFVGDKTGQPFLMRLDRKRMGLR